MARMITGRDTLKLLDNRIARSRRQLDLAIDAANRAKAQVTEIRAEQVSAYRALAQIRIDLLHQTSPAEPSLNSVEKRALILLDSHEAYVAAEQEKIRAASDEIAQLEHERETLAQELDSALDAYEIRVARVEAIVAEDEDYQNLTQQLQSTGAMAERALSKLEIAKEDEKTKGAPYQNDPLFSYLWERNFRTPGYKASSLVRILDNWVAKLCRYDQAYLNYQHLNELPLRLAEHAERMEHKRNMAQAALEEAESAALQEAGAHILQKRVDDIRAGIESLDHQIDAVETRHQALVESHEKALSSETGPAAEARRVLEDGLRRAGFPELRLLVAETIDKTDDQIVDRLVKLRTEELELEITSDDFSRAPGERRRELLLLEDLRRNFKTANFDSSYATFHESQVDSAIADLLREKENVRRTLSRLGRAMTKRQTRVSADFGGSRRRSSLRLPSILGEVATEIAKEAGRRSNYNTFPTRKRSPRPRFPAPRPGSGGFKTGGGF